MSTRKFDTLYGLDKNGKFKEWNIHVTNKGTFSEMYYSYGQVGGKKTECTFFINKGKNIGKKNETTHYQQAILEAESKWTKKKDTDGYQTDLNNLTNKSLDNQPTSTNVLPMLAHDYKKQNHKIKFPCYIQPKLDGYRMVYNPKTKSVTSRTGKSYDVLKETDLYKNDLADVSMCLDGELYVHDTQFVFEQYGVLRKQKCVSSQDSENLNLIKYHVYDTIDTEQPFSERVKQLETLAGRANIEIVPTFVCTSKEDIDTYHAKFIEEGYEGSMIRNAHGRYVCKYRSYDLLKKKDFDDNEFKIVDFTSEKDTSGSNQPLIVWICETLEGRRFSVQSKGTKAERQKLYKTATEYIGHMLWVQHFGLTADGVPRFPKSYRGATESIRSVKY